MTSYISNDLNMVKELDPARHELALLQEEFLSHGGAIEVLMGPSFQPPPKRHEPPPRKKPAKSAPAPKKLSWADKMAQRDIEREERLAFKSAEKAARIEHIRKLAGTMTYAQAVLVTGLPLRSLQRAAVEGGFKFQPAINSGQKNLRTKVIDEELDAKNAERIRKCMAEGLSRHQAMSQIGVTFKTFGRLLAKFNIDYPKRVAGPHPAFFPKPSKQE